MASALDHFARLRARDLGLSLVDLCESAGISRQTFYALADVPDKLPSLQTLIALARVLNVHPMRLLQLLFDETHPSTTAGPRPRRGDRSAFVRDVNIPDGQLVLPGQGFDKVWELQNVGSVAWEHRFLQCMDEEVIVYTRSGDELRLAQNLIHDGSRIPIPTTAPGETVQLRVRFKAPHSPGTVISYWKMVLADGSLCFPRSRGVWVRVQISSLASAADGAPSQAP